MSEFKQRKAAEQLIKKFREAVEYAKAEFGANAITILGAFELMKSVIFNEAWDTVDEMDPQAPPEFEQYLGEDDEDEDDDLQELN